MLRPQPQIEDAQHSGNYNARTSACTVEVAPASFIPPPRTRTVSRLNLLSTPLHIQFFTAETQRRRVV